MSPANRSPHDLWQRLVPPGDTNPTAYRLALTYLLGELVRQARINAELLGIDPNDEVVRARLMRRAFTSPGRRPDVDDARALAMGANPSPRTDRIPAHGRRVVGLFRRPTRREETTP